MRVNKRKFTISEPSMLSISKTYLKLLIINQYTPEQCSPTAIQNYISKIYQASIDKPFTKTQFCKIFPFNGIIGESFIRLFKQDLSLQNVSQILNIFYIGTLDNRMQFVFNMYDSNNDGRINREDVRLLLAHVPFNNTVVENENKDLLIEIQTEIIELTNHCFLLKDEINLKDFTLISTELFSDMFITIFQYIRANIPSVKIIDAVSMEETTNNGSSNNKTQKIAPVKYLQHFEPITPIIKAIHSIKSNLEDIAYETDSNNMQMYDGRMFECHSKYNVEENNYPKNSSLSKIAIFNVPSPKVSSKLPNVIEDEMMISNCFSNRSTKSNLYRLRNNELVECMVILDRKLLTIVDSDKKEIQVFTVLYSCAKKEAFVEIKEYTYFPIKLFCDKGNSLILYCASELEQSRWSAYLNCTTSSGTREDNYEFGSIIHKGMGSIVQMATNKQTNEKLAVKIICKKTVADLSQLKNQIDMLTMIKHVNIVELIDTIDSPEMISLVFKYLEGPNLSVCLSKQFSNDNICKIMHSITSAIYSLKEFGVVHRDIQLTSIMFTKNDLNSDVKLVNFSLLGLCSNGDCLEGFKGSLRFVAPEIISQRKCDSKADVWSLGVVFFSMLAMSLPFEGDSATDVMNSILNKEPDFSKGALASRTPNAIDLAKKMLLKDPKARIEIDEVLLHPYLRVSSFLEVNTKDKLSMYRMLSKSSKNLDKLAS